MRTGNLVIRLATYVSRAVPLNLKRYFYKSPMVSSLIRNGLNRNVPEGMIQVPIAAGPNVGLEMLLNLKLEKDYWLGTYEVDLQAMIDKLVEPDKVIYDIGANIGFFTLMFAKKTGKSGHVYAFEALPENVERLRKNVEINGFIDRVSIMNAAVQDRSGEVDFLIGPSPAMGKVDRSAGRVIDHAQKFMIEGISIDDFVDNLGNPPPDIVKVDIEGGEVLAFPGMAKSLDLARPVVMVELHGPESSRVCWDELRRLEYRICRMEPDLPQVYNLEDLDWKSYIIAFPNEE